MWSDGGGGWSGWFTMVLAMVVFWGLVAGVVVAVVALVRGRSAGSRSRTGGAEDLLAERFARGEIDEQEYAEGRKVLGVQPGRLAAIRGPALVLAVAGLAVVVLLAVGGWVGGWVDGDGWWGGRPHPMMGGTRSAEPAPPPEPGAPQVRVTGTEFAFSPDEVRVAVGETVNVLFDNEGDAYHTFTVPELDFELAADGGDHAEGALTASSTGTYEVVCAVAGHTEAGMRGALVVDGGER